MTVTHKKQVISLLRMWLLLSIVLQVLTSVMTSGDNVDVWVDPTVTRRPTMAPTGTAYNIPTSEFNALRDFYNALNGPYWKWHVDSKYGIQWNVSDPYANPCLDHWQGIKCGNCFSPVTCHVTVVEFEQQNLTGSIPSSIALLTKLEAITLTRNNITGSLPMEFWTIKGLTSMNLMYNFFTGTIPPEIINLSNLTQLIMNHNQIHGELPEELYLLDKLGSVQFYSNRLEGTLSPKLAMLQNLFTLLLNHNRLYGTIPDAVANMTRLNSFGVSHNFLTSTIPESIGTMTKLSVFDISYNLLHGTLPPGLIHIESLTEFTVAHNAFYGSIPFEIFRSSRLQLLDLGLNSFSGSISEAVSSLTSVKELYINYNFLTGNINTQFERLFGCVTLDFNTNYLFGSVVNAFQSQREIVTIDFHQNMLTGSLPAGDWPKLLYYLMSNNYFVGTIPMKLSNITVLNYFDISNNQIEGEIPQFILTTRGMKYIYLSNNQLTGSLVFENPTTMSELSLDGNELRGSLPDNIDVNVPNLVSLNLQSNGFTGTLPSGLFQLYNLQRLFLQNNQFYGSVPMLSNISVSGESYISAMTNVDLSNNQFTGPLPINSLVGSKFLSSFAASSNCFDASISSDVCDITTLTCLALDGISTATNCRSIIFSSLQDRAFTITKYMNRQYPQCLFQMPLLQSLHLSGNRMIGSLSDKLAISPSLTDMVLSHNLLTGTIPTSIQTRMWENLDLSYNRFKGSLAHNFPSLASDASLSLSVNRLSGNIPGSLKHALNISILEGNLFTCNEQRSDLPEHDPDTSIYNCGSDTVNRSLFLWIVAFCFPMLLAVCFYYFILRRSTTTSQKELSTSENKVKGSKETSISLMEAVSLFQFYFIEYNRMLVTNIDILPEDNTPLSNRESNAVRPSEGMPGLRDLRNLFDKDEVHFLLIFFIGIRQVLMYALVFIFVVLCPVYIIISLYYSMYTSVYAWNISALFLSGKTPGLTMFFGCIVAIILIHATFEKVIFAKYRNYQHSHVEVVNFEKAWDSRRFITLAIIAFLNFNMMIWLDIVYVFVTISASTSVIAVVQIILAVVKVFWNEVFLWNSIPRIWYVTSWVMTSGKETIPSYIRSREDLNFIVFNVIMNNLFLPSLAVAAVSKTCFYNTIIAPPSVEAIYTYTTCNSFVLLHRNGYFCYEEGTATGSSTYSPPYLYSYQCSSTVIVNYVAIYIYMFLLLGIFLPAVRVAGRLYLDYLEENKIYLSVQDFLRTILPANLKLDIGPDPAFHFRDTADTTENPMTNSLDHGSITEVSMPSVSVKSNLSADKTVANIIFDRDRLLVRLNSFFGIILTYGVLFPPLALIGTVAAISVTFYEQTFVIGRMLWIANTRKCYSQYRQQLNVEAKHIAEGFVQSIYIVAPFASIVYAYLIFDTIGDESGWEASMGPAVTLLMVSPFCYFIFYLISFTKKKFQNSLPNEHSIGTIELLHTNQTAETPTSAQE